MSDTHRIIEIQPLPHSIGRVINDVLFKGDGATSNFRHAGTNSGLERWYCAGVSNNGAMATGAPTANVLRAIPFAAPARGAYIDRLGYNITATVAGNTRIGLYTNVDDSNLYPDKRLEDSGSIVNGNGVKTYTVARKLRPGDLYWLVIVGDVAPTIRTIPLGNCSPILGCDNTLPAQGSCGLSVAFAYAALPATFPAGAAEIVAIPVPALYVRFSR